MTTMATPTTRQTGGKRKPLIEELITIETQVGLTLHAYMIVLPEEYLEQAPKVHALICETAEKNGWRYLPIILATRLSDGTGKVLRRILGQNKAARASINKALSGAEDFHITVVVMPTGSADDRTLMDLH